MAKEMRGDDAGPYQVRSSQRENASLILHPEDLDDKIYYLITGANGNYMVCGYISGKNGKQQKYWKDPTGGRPAFFVPQADLKDN